MSRQTDRVAHVESLLTQRVLTLYSDKLQAKLGSNTATGGISNGSSNTISTSWDLVEKSAKAIIASLAPSAGGFPQANEQELRKIAATLSQKFPVHPTVPLCKYYAVPVPPSSRQKGGVRPGNQNGQSNGGYDLFPTESTPAALSSAKNLNGLFPPLQPVTPRTSQRRYELLMHGSKQQQQSQQAVLPPQGNQASYEQHQPQTPQQPQTARPVSNQINNSSNKLLAGLDTGALEQLAMIQQSKSPSQALAESHRRRREEKWFKVVSVERAAWERENMEKKLVQAHKRDTHRQELEAQMEEKAKRAMDVQCLEAETESKVREAVAIADARDAQRKSYQQDRVGKVKTEIDTQLAETYKDKEVRKARELLEDRKSRADIDQAVELDRQKQLEKKLNWRKANQEDLAYNEEQQRLKASMKKEQQHWDQTMHKAYNNQLKEEDRQRMLFKEHIKEEQNRRIAMADAVSSPNRSRLEGIEERAQREFERARDAANERDAIERQRRKEKNRLVQESLKHQMQQRQEMERKRAEANREEGQRIREQDRAALEKSRQERLQHRSAAQQNLEAVKHQMLVKMELPEDMTEVEQRLNARILAASA